MRHYCYLAFFHAFLLFTLVSPFTTQKQHHMQYHPDSLRPPKSNRSVLRTPVHEFIRQAKTTAHEECRLLSVRLVFLFLYLLCGTVKGKKPEEQRPFTASSIRVSRRMNRSTALIRRKNATNAAADYATDAGVRSRPDHSTLRLPGCAAVQAQVQDLLRHSRHPAVAGVPGTTSFQRRRPSWAASSRHCRAPCRRTRACAGHPSKARKPGLCATER